MLRTSFCDSAICRTACVWIMSQGFPELGPAARRRRARERLREVRTWLERPAGLRPVRPPATHSEIAASQLAPQFPVPGPPGLTSNFSSADYLRAVERAIE